MNPNTPTGSGGGSHSVSLAGSRMPSQGNSASIPAKLVMLHTGVVEEGVVAVDRVMVVEGGWQWREQQRRWKRKCQRK